METNEEEEGLTFNFESFWEKFEYLQRIMGELLGEERKLK
jgi:hypothetical protein